jgi:predicted N-acyltransferase
MNHPFANTSFLELLEQTGCVGDQTGWIPHHFKTTDATLPTYAKFHSHGEYIFDWNWANFYEQNELDYYPKLMHCIPFTPVNAPKIIGNKDDFQKLAHESFDFYKKHNLNSEHYLFINADEQQVLEELGFTTKLTHQYHFSNEYESFDDFLGKLKKNKRKNIKKERRSITESDLEIKHYTRENFNQDILDNFFHFYISTIAKKYSYAYLNQKFFTGLKDHNFLIISAEKENTPIAMALFFYDDKTLYGRNWGIGPRHESAYPFLHFELCYYQGIDFCIKNKLKTFEAGAQGEHKLTRGFRPVVIKSAHHIKIPQCYEIIKKDIQRQNAETQDLIPKLTEYLPFKLN